MTIHSVATPATSPRLPASARTTVPADKRAAILEAATAIFAERGFFNAQVADIARGAGIAAGTVTITY